MPWSQVPWSQARLALEPQGDDPEPHRGVGLTSEPVTAPLPGLLGRGLLGGLAPGLTGPKAILQRGWLSGGRRQHSKGTPWEGRSSGGTQMRAEEFGVLPKHWGPSQEAEGAFPGPSTVLG